MILKKLFKYLQLRWIYVQSGDAAHLQCDAEGPEGVQYIFNNSQMPSVSVTEHETNRETSKRSSIREPSRSRG